MCVAVLPVVIGLWPKLKVSVPFAGGGGPRDVFGRTAEEVRQQMAVKDADAEARAQMVAKAIDMAERSKLYRQWTKPIRDLASKEGITFHQAQEEFSQAGMKSFKLLGIHDPKWQNPDNPDGLVADLREKYVILGAIVNRALVADQDPERMIGDFRIRVEFSPAGTFYSEVPENRGGEWHWKSMD
jgi:hypothetical protein